MVLRLLLLLLVLVVVAVVVVVVVVAVEVVEGVQVVASHGVAHGEVLARREVLLVAQVLHVGNARAEIGLSEIGGAQHEFVHVGHVAAVDVGQNVLDLVVGARRPQIQFHFHRVRLRPSPARLLLLLLLLLRLRLPVACLLAQLAPRNIENHKSLSACRARAAQSQPSYLSSFAKLHLVSRGPLRELAACVALLWNSSPLANG